MLEEYERGFVGILDSMVTKGCVLGEWKHLCFVGILNDMVTKVNNK